MKVNSFEQDHFFMHEIEIEIEFFFILMETGTNANDEDVNMQDAA